MVKVTFHFLQLSSFSPMNVKKLWTIEAKSVQYSLTFVKHLTQPPPTTSAQTLPSSSESISLKMDTELSV